MKFDFKITSPFPLKIKLPIFIVVLIQMGCGDNNKQQGHSTESMTESFEALHDSKKSTEQRRNSSNDNQIYKDTTKLKRLKLAFSTKDSELFLKEFPESFKQFHDYFGWNYGTDEPKPLYKESSDYIDYFFDILTDEEYEAYESKLINISKNGSWQPDAINYFQELTLEYIKNSKRYHLIESLNSNDAKSVLFYLFDGPHPKFDTEFASQLSTSKKEIFEGLFENGFYDLNENPERVLDEQSNTVPYQLSNYLGTEHFFIRDIDINNDSVLDKIVSSSPYQENELLLFINQEDDFKCALKTINFSEDGGNQIVDVIAKKGGFVIKTAFPDGGLLEAYHHITFKEPQWILTHTIYRTQSSNQEDNFSYVCTVNQGLNMADTYISQKLKWLPNERERERVCEIEKMN